MNTDSYQRKSAETSATKNPTANLKCQVAEHYWDPVGRAIVGNL
jgi:hypothetical protein